MQAIVPWRQNRAKCSYRPLERAIMFIPPASTDKMFIPPAPTGKMFIPHETWLPAAIYALARNATFSTNLDSKHWDEMHILRSKMSRAFNFDQIFNFWLHQSALDSEELFAVRYFASYIFVLIIFLLKIWKNWNYFHNNFLRLRVNLGLGKLYIVFSECLGTHRIQLTYLLFHLVVINKFYEQIDK